MKTILSCLLVFLATFSMDAQNKRTKVQITTNKGDIVVELYNETPIHRDNFIELVKKGFYDGTLFHRCIKAFMVQGGDPDSKKAEYGQALGMGDIGYTLPAEIKPEFAHTRGALAAARTGNNVNPEKRSSGCQFYIVQGQAFTRDQIERFNSQRRIKYTDEQIKEYLDNGGTPHLDNEYTVFGRVISGWDVVETISNVDTDSRNRPIEDIAISMKIIK